VFGGTLNLTFNYVVGMSSTSPSSYETYTGMLTLNVYNWTARVILASLLQQ